MGYQIKELRERNNMTQQDLSDKSGISRAIINGLETERLTNTSLKTLKKLADALEKYPNRYQRLHETHPKLWKACMDQFGFRDVLNYINVPIEPNETKE